MKSRKLIGFMVGLLFSVTGCLQEDPKAPQGVHVGNAMTSYASPLGYQLRFHSSLNYSHSEDHKSVKVSNQDLRESEDRLSELNIKVESPPTLNDYPAFERYVKTRHAGDGLSFERVAIKGAKALYSEPKEDSDGKHTRMYYVLTEPSRLIAAKLQAYPEAKGKELLSPVMQTIEVDTQAPQLMGFQLPFWDRRFEAGKTNRLLIHALDNVKVVKARLILRAKINSRLYLARKVKRSSVLQRLAPIVIEAPLEPTGAPFRAWSKKHWHRMEFSLHSYHVQADYEVASITVFDAIGNSTTWTHGDERLYTMEETIYVANAGKQDLEGPVIESIEAPLPLITGKRNRILVKVKDEISGIATSTHSVKHSTLVGELTRVDRNNRIVPGHPTLALKRIEVIELNKVNNEYAIDFDLPAHKAEGTWVISLLDISDKAGNTTTLQLREQLNRNVSNLNYRINNEGRYSYRRTRCKTTLVNVKNPSGFVDRKAPAVTKVAFAKNTKIGHWATLTVGIDEANGLKSIQFILQTKSNKGKQTTMHVSDAKFSLSKDQKEATINFPIDPRMLAAESHIVRLEVIDRAANRSIFTPKSHPAIDWGSIQLEKNPEITYSARTAPFVKKEWVPMEPLSPVVENGYGFGILIKDSKSEDTSTTKDSLKTLFSIMGYPKANTQLCELQAATTGDDFFKELRYCLQKMNAVATQQAKENNHKQPQLTLVLEMTQKFIISQAIYQSTISRVDKNVDVYSVDSQRFIDEILSDIDPKFDLLVSIRTNSNAGIFSELKNNLTNKMIPQKRVVFLNSPPLKELVKPLNPAQSLSHADFIAELGDIKRFSTKHLDETERQKLKAAPETLIDKFKDYAKKHNKIVQQPSRMWLEALGRKATTKNDLANEIDNLLTKRGIEDERSAYFVAAYLQEKAKRGKSIDSSMAYGLFQKFIPFKKWDRHVDTWIHMSDLLPPKQLVRILLCDAVQAPARWEAKAIGSRYALDWAAIHLAYLQRNIDDGFPLSTLLYQAADEDLVRSLEASMEHLRKHRARVVPGDVHRYDSGYEFLEDQLYYLRNILKRKK